MSNGNSTGKSVLLGVLAVIGALALIVGGYLAVVALSQPVGVGNAIIKKNSAENWTRAQAEFEDRYADILATENKLVVACTALRDDPEDKTLRTNFTGLSGYYLTVVGEYNAEARKFLSQDFRAADLPSEITPSRTATECEEK